MKELIELKKYHELGMPAISPFNFKYTVYKPSHFPTGLEEFNETTGVFYRTFRLSGDKILGLKMSDLERIRGGEGIFLEVYSVQKLDKQDLVKLEEHVNGAYGLKEDINKFYENVKSDKNLNVIIDNLRGMRNSCFETLYEIMNISFMLQNTTVKRSEQMMQNMLFNFGKRVSYDRKELYVFYVPEDIANSSEERLRELKVGYRAKFLMEIAKYLLHNSDFEEELKTMDFQDAKKNLMTIKGIGPYSARIILFQYFRNPHEINFDSWKRKIFSKLFFGNEDEGVEKVEKEAIERWGDYSGYAGLYVIENLFVKNPEMQYWKRRMVDKY